MSVALAPLPAPRAVLLGRYEHINPFVIPAAITGNPSDLSPALTGSHRARRI
jgi:hypothetical protein